MKAKLMLLTLLLTTLTNMNPAKARRLGEGTLEIIPVKNLKTEDESAMVFNNKHLKPLTKEPILTIERFSYKQVASEARGLSSIRMDEKAEKDFAKAAKKYKGGNFAVIMNGEVIATPKFKHPNKFTHLM